MRKISVNEYQLDSKRVIRTGFNHWVVADDKGFVRLALSKDLAKYLNDDKADDVVEEMIKMEINQ